MKSSLTVYRWEILTEKFNTKKYWIGPMTAYNYDGRLILSDRAARKNIRCKPEPSSDCPGWFRGMLCATTSLDKLEDWIDVRAAAMLELQGFVIGVYEVPEDNLYVGKHQVTFHPDNAVRRRSMSYADSLLLKKSYWSRERMIDKLNRFKWRIQNEYDNL